MKIPVLVSISKLSVAWLVLVLLMAGFVGYLAAVSALATQQLREAYSERREAISDHVAAREARQREEEALARLQAILDNAEQEQRHAAEVSSL